MKKKHLWFKCKECGKETTTLHKDIQKAKLCIYCRIKKEIRKESVRLEMEGQANAIKVVNESAKRYFVGNAQQLKKLEVTQASLENNTKYIVPEKAQLVTMIDGASGIVPIRRSK